VGFVLRMIVPVVKVLASTVAVLVNNAEPTLASPREQSCRKQKNQRRAKHFLPPCDNSGTVQKPGFVTTHLWVIAKRRFMRC